MQNTDAYTQLSLCLHFKEDTMKKKEIIIFALVVLTAMFSGCTKSAKEEQKPEVVFPEKPITIICPWGIGGGADTIARTVAQIGRKYIGQHIVVENHTGASGTIGLNDTLRKPADGYTLVTVNGPLFSLTPKFISVEYTLADFSFLKGMRTVYLFLMTNPKASGLNTFDDVLNYGKSHKIKYGTSSGPGGDQYIVATAAFKSLGIDAEPVVFDSQAEVINAIVSGQIFTGIGAPTDEQIADFVNIGTCAQVATFFPAPVETSFGIVQPVKNWTNVEFAGMDCFAVRSDVPETVKKKLIDMLTKVYQDPEFIDTMKKLGFPIWDAGPEEVTQFVNNQMGSMDTYVELIK
jgi:tripartite-type tricarboxylate transporter receptor subunit TctC